MLFIVFSFMCSVFCFVCLCLCLETNIACVSVLSILDCPLHFLYCCFFFLNNKEFKFRHVSKAMTKTNNIFYCQKSLKNVHCTHNTLKLATFQLYHDKKM